MKKVGWLLMGIMLAFAAALPVHASDMASESFTDQDVALITETPDPSESEAPHEHSWGNAQVTEAPTCTNSGIRTLTCACGETAMEKILATGHAYGSWNIYEEGHSRVCANCGDEEQGSHNYTSWQDQGTDHSKTCTVCAHTVSEAHNRSNSTVLKPPTCNEEGKMGKVCAVCSSVVEESTPKLKVHTYDSACDGKCNVCGIPRDVVHDFKKVWIKDSTGHWYACSKCDEKLSFAKHNPGPEATEEKEQLCLTCNYVIKPKKTHTHSFERQWTSDETGHWHACKTCTAEESHASHSYQNACDSTCEICDYKKDTRHTYDDQWITTKHEHWNVCGVCGEESKHEKHIAGPEATEKTPQLCTVCNFELEPVQVHTHDFSREWEWDTVNHWQLCSCGEASVAMVHSWDQGRSLKKDVMEYHCTMCGATKMEQKESGFPWGILLIVLAVICIGGIVVLVILLKRGQFDDDSDDNSGDFSDEFLREPQEAVPVDEEENMIDDFFASLDKE